MKLTRPTLIPLPAGRFFLGAVANDKFANATERPVQEVEIKSEILLGKYPVTVGEYRECFPSHALGEMADLPVVDVSWRDAVDYCRWLGDGFRLPKEAEWEYACRAGSRQIFSGSDDMNIEVANYLYDEAGQRVGVGRRLPAGSFPANEFGFYEMLGNVCEWVDDLWRPNYAAAPNLDERHVIRGGAWDYLPRLLRCSWRDSLAADARRDNVGFRIACDLIKITSP